jgi:1-acyl-sn-glycerol-3-phosphate acyltransferase
MNAPHKLPPVVESEVDITTEDPLWYNLVYYFTKAYFTLFHDIRTVDAWRVPSKGPVLLLPNHTSFFDPPVVGVALQRRSFYLARKTLFNNRIFAKLIKSINAIPIDQKSAGWDGIRHSITLLENHKALVVFPEGTRTMDGEMVDFQPGVHLLLKRCPVPVVPVGIAGAHECLPMGRGLRGFSPLGLRHNRQNVVVSFGEPVNGAFLADMPRKEALRRMEVLVKAQVARAREVYKSRQKV